MSAWFELTTPTPLPSLWLRSTLQYNDVPWPWYCTGNDCIECDGNWFVGKAMYPSCNRNKITGFGDWRTMNINDNSDNKITALKNYLQSDGTFGYNFQVDNDFMHMGSNLGGWFGSECDNELPYKGGGDSCCRKKKKRVCSWWGSCKDRSSECDGKKGGHAVRITGYGTRNGEEYWKMQNSWGTGWAQSGYLEISTKNARWGWSNINVDSGIFRRVLAEVPEFGLDYLHDEDAFGLRFLEDEEIEETWKPGFNIDMEVRAGAKRQRYAYRNPSTRRFAPRTYCVLTLLPPTRRFAPRPAHPHRSPTPSWRSPRLPWTSSTAPLSPPTWMASRM